MDRPQLAFPVQFTSDGTGLVMVEQDFEDDVASCIGTILSWPLGTHPSNPTFGLPDESFLQGGARLAEIKQAILSNEPRAADLGVMQDDAQLAAYISQITVGFDVKALTQ